VLCRIVYNEIGNRHDVLVSLFLWDFPSENFHNLPFCEGIFSAIEREFGAVFCGLLPMYVPYEFCNMDKTFFGFLVFSLFTTFFDQALFCQ
jgi:hypothetical protein